NRQLTDGPGSPRGLAALRREAEQRAERGGVTDEGTTADDPAPAGWDVASLTGSGRPLRVSLSGAQMPRGTVEVAAPALVTTADLEQRRALAATALLLGVLFAVWLLSAFPSFVALAHFFWPEQALLLGLFGLQLFGATGPVLFLLVLGGSARLFALASGLLRFIARPRPRQPHPARPA